MFKIIQEGLQEANATMQTMVNHHVMTMVPSLMRKKYLADVFTSITLMASNKRIKLKMEQQELQLYVEQIKAA
jgi:hypothetical protein